MARSCLNKAAKRMKKWADKKRRHMEYQVGDLVLVKLSTLDRYKGLHKSLIRTVSYTHLTLPTKRIV